jgi:hypothetical protein
MFRIIEVSYDLTSAPVFSDLFIFYSWTDYMTASSRFSFPVLASVSVAGLFEAAGTNFNF